MPLVISEFFEPFSHVLDGLIKAILTADDIHGFLEDYDEGCYEVPTRSCSPLSGFVGRTLQLRSRRPLRGRRRTELRRPPAPASMNPAAHPRDAPPSPPAVAAPEVRAARVPRLMRSGSFLRGSFMITPAIEAGQGTIGLLGHPGHSQVAELLLGD